jgi:putative oxidoreductase
MFKSLAKHSDFGLLIGRLGVGIVFLVLGWQKLAGGQPAWTHYGHAMATIGIRFMPNIWGLLAALAEFVGGILIIVGFLFRPAAALIAFAMVIAFASTFREHPHNFIQYSHAIEMFCIMIVFLFVGPGKYSFEGS